jgi:hypothetical protein
LKVEENGIVFCDIESVRNQWMKWLKRLCEFTNLYRVDLESTRWRRPNVPKELFMVLQEMQKRDVSDFIRVIRFFNQNRVGWIR